jgi:endonuclease YncB( thermonuclease family)
MRTPTFTLVLAAATLTLLPLVPAASGAATVRESGRVVHVPDGDTVDVATSTARTAGETTTQRVRLIGIDTPEVGSCGSKSASRALKRLAGGSTVEMTSDQDLSGKKSRTVRRVVVLRDGRRIDATRWMLWRGHGPWMPRIGELTGNLADHRAAARAAAKGLRFFNPARCRSGPRQAVRLGFDVQWEQDVAPGVDRLNEEFIRITNHGRYGIQLSGWTLRVGNNRQLRIPTGKSVAGGRTLTVHIGSGKNRRYHRYLGRSVPMLGAASEGSEPHVGSGAYLVDPDGDLRAYQTWPCVRRCADPTRGALRMRVRHDPPGPDSDDVNGERIGLTNVGSRIIRTGKLVIDAHPYVYELPPKHRLKPGETLTIHAGKGKDSRLQRYIGSSKPILNNAGDRVLVRTYDAIVVACEDWGSGRRCP